MLVTRTSGEEDVGRFHVSVDEPALVCCIESIRDLRDERESTLRLERGLSSKQST